MIVKCCTAAEILEDPGLPDLLQEYKLEGERLPGAEFLPERYYALERAGILQTFKAYNTSNEFVGFGTVICNVVPHYKAPVGVIESVFLRKSARRSGLGLDLFIAMEDHCKAHAQCMYVTAPAGSVLQRLLPKLGFTLSNLVFLKVFS